MSEKYSRNILTARHHLLYQPEKIGEILTGAEKVEGFFVLIFKCGNKINRPDVECHKHFVIVVQILRYFGGNSLKKLPENRAAGRV